MDGAVVGRDCKIGDHCFIESGAVVGNSVTIKNNTLIWDRVTIEDEVFVGPNVVFTNDLIPRVGFPTTPAEFLPTSVGRGASIGANSTILCGITIGRYAMVGAGSTVTRSVPDHALVYGNPARLQAWVCYCGNRLNGNTECSICGRVVVGLGESTGAARIPLV
jgi:acetyltransferase-like isoleucine patch superfamily enzyme